MGRDGAAVVARGSASARPAGVAPPGRGRPSWRALLAAAVACPLVVPGSRASDAGPCPLLLVRTAPEGARLVLDSLETGATQVLPLGRRSGVLTALLPVAVGRERRSVALEPGPGSTLTARCREGRLSLAFWGGPTEDSHTPWVAASDVRRLRIRVRLDAPGRPASGYLVRDGRILAPDPMVTGAETGGGWSAGAGAPDGGGGAPGAGRGTPSVGSLLVTMDVEEPTEGRMTGSVPLRSVGPYLVSSILVPGGGSGEAVVDLGTTRTTMARSVLARSREPELRPAGDRLGPGRESATALAGELRRMRRMRMPEVRIGSLSFRRTTVNVLDYRPIVHGHELSAVVGTDLLGRADVLRIRPPTAHEDGVLELLTEGEARATATPPDAEVPFVGVAGLIVVPGSVDGRLAPLVLDTGSPVSLITPALASAAGLFPVAGDPTPIAGIDGGVIRAWPGMLEDLQVGDATFRAVPVAIAAMPVLEDLGLPEGAGLLGQAFLARLRMLEVDWRRGLVRFYRRSAPAEPRR